MKVALSDDRSWKPNFDLFKWPLKTGFTVIVVIMCQSHDNYKDNSGVDLFMDPFGSGRQELGPEKIHQAPR